MRLADFDYELPEELIAQSPLSHRGSSRMLVLHAKTGNCDIRNFKDICEYLDSGDCIVVNNSKVIKARLFGQKKDTGAKIEILLIKPHSKIPNIWECLVKPGKRIKPGTKICLLEAKNETVSNEEIVCADKSNDGIFYFDFSEVKNFQEMLEKCGHVPLPPYIRRKDEAIDTIHYQSVFAKYDGSVAAPTASLHFTEEILSSLKKKGVEKAEITLHVGPGTFLPVSAEEINEHKMHSEPFCLEASEAKKINRAKNSGKKILAVGTTTVRVLETCANENGNVSPRNGETDIFIRPPMKPKVANMLLTNFHLPKSTLLMLVSCFADREKILNAYRLAIKEKFRFYSYGDCMLIVR